MRIIFYYSNTVLENAYPKTFLDGIFLMQYLFDMPYLFDHRYSKRYNSITIRYLIPKIYGIITVFLKHIVKSQYPKILVGRHGTSELQQISMSRHYYQWVSDSEFVA